MTTHAEARRTLVLIRHAQSEWNLQGRFTGWADPGLTDSGREEACAAGRALAQAGCRFDLAYCSRLQRTRLTAELVLASAGQAGLAIHRDWRLNERHYGALQGMDKLELTQRWGEQKVWRMRRGYRDLPPALQPDDPRHPRHQPLYADLDPALLPATENLADTRQRVGGFWREVILPRVRNGERVLIASHGNTLRALLMELDGLSESQVEAFEIPTGQPILYQFAADGRPLGWHYLGSAELSSAA